MVSAGFGLALLPASSIDEELRAGTLHALRIPALHARIPVALVQRRRAFHSGATKALLAILTAWPALPSPKLPAARSTVREAMTRRGAKQAAARARGDRSNATPPRRG